MNKEEQKEMVGEATPEQIAMWKNLHGKVWEVRSKDSVCYLKRPHRNVVSAASSLGAKDPIKFAEMMIANCWLGGDERIKTDDAKFFGLSKKLDMLLQVEEASVKEL